MIINGVHMDDKGEPIDKFALEQAIMEAWQVVNDLKLLLERLEYLTEDQVFCAIHGLQIFADMRCESLWNTYENYLSNERLKNGDKRQTEITEALDEVIESFGQEKL